MYLFNFKTSPFLLIFLAFAFRILFVNVSLISSFNNAQTNNLTSKYFSTIQKKRRQAETTAQTNTPNYQTEDVYEVNSDPKESIIKIISPILLFFLLACCGKIVTSGSGRIFSSAEYYLYPKKYLTHSILRI